jgi:phospholipase C
LNRAGIAFDDAGRRESARCLLPLASSICVLRFYSKADQKVLEGGAIVKRRRPLYSSSLQTRRQFLQSAAVLGGALAVEGVALDRLFSQSVLPPPESSGIEHVVVLMMENRSFDHMLGWVEGADGRQRGLRYADDDGTLHRTYRLAPDFQGCGHPDPDHSYEGGRVEYNDGACDGWLRAGNNDDYALGFYVKKDLPFFGGAAAQWTVCDRYFSSKMAGTFANRVYQHAAQTDRLDNTFQLSTLTTIWDLLAAANLEGRYYFSDLPFLALWGPKYVGIARSTEQFFLDAAAGTLPHVAFVEPRFLGAQAGLSNDDHPFADLRNGQAFMNRVYRAVTQSPNWPNTVFVINYDEWGGFFDHVPPPLRPVPAADPLRGDNDGLLGFRTPCFVISPFARREHVSHVVLDHTSVLKMIEWRWNLPALSVRDEVANNLASVLDFSARPRGVKQISVPMGPFGQFCVPGLPDETDEEWLPLLKMAADFNWPVTLPLPV